MVAVLMVPTGTADEFLPWHAPAGLPPGAGEASGPPGRVWVGVPELPEGLSEGDRVVLAEPCAHLDSPGRHHRPQCWTCEGEGVVQRVVGRVADDGQPAIVPVLDFADRAAWPTERGDTITVGELGGNPWVVLWDAEGRDGVELSGEFVPGGFGVRVSDTEEYTP